LPYDRTKVAHLIGLGRALQFILAIELLRRVVERTGIIGGNATYFRVVRFRTTGVGQAKEEK
jgi:hypothetical protein